MARAISTNKWPVHTNQNGLAVVPYVTGKVAPGAPQVILGYLCERYHREVEPIRKGWSWGWAYRPVRGRLSGFSNHASATAVDINAPLHPMWKRNTFTAHQKAAVRRILADIGLGVLRWGEDYRVRVDGMHFELDKPPNHPAIQAAVKKILATKNPGLPVAPKPPSRPSGALPPFSLANVVNSRARRTHHANIEILQRALNNYYLEHGQGRLKVDGYWGPNMERVFNAYRQRVMKLTRVKDYTGAPGKQSVQHVLRGKYMVV